MKRGLAIFLAVVLTIGAVGFIGLCLESLQGGDVPAFVKNLALVQTPSPTPLLAPAPPPAPATSAAAGRLAEPAARPTAGASQPDVAGAWG